MISRMFDEEFQREKYERAMERKYKAIGFKIGFEEGFEEAVLESKISIALNLLKLGKISKEDIAYSTDLPLEKITELANGM